MQFETLFLMGNQWTDNPIEAEVSSAVAAYKMRLIQTSYRSFWHRFMCWSGDRDARSVEDALVQAKHHAMTVVNKSEAHRSMLKRLVKLQTEDVAKKDNLLSLLGEISEANTCR
ncbi:hypothetical protein [Alcaligenes faecalis]|uniref:hypothetical protein n=1 Tax=Alcaligenes faecalis TaxID=511 RepID=UPI0024BD2683|nr:hypothetical protein [Alcaligenes faecalis]WHQ45926.1 hypothetical protein E8D21_19960 [Alcaligenes faecalis]